MELEKLKEIWTSLDDRMQQQEGLKTVIIKEMLLSKSDKALSRLINYNYFGLVVIFTIIPVLVWWYSHAYFVAFKIPIFLSVFILLTVSLVSGVVVLMKLHKVDFSKPVSCNIAVISKYKIFYKRMTLIACLIVTLLLALCIINIFLWSNVEPWRWAGIISGIFVGIAVGYWEYKRIVMRNINSILNSLEELKELEEPDEK